MSWNGATEVKSWRLQIAEYMSASDEEFITIQELGRDTFKTSFELDGVLEANVGISALDRKRLVLAYTAVVSAASSSSVS